MEFGAHLFGVGAMANPRALVEATRLAEDAGYHSVFLADHVLLPRGLQSKYPYSRAGASYGGRKRDFTPSPSRACMHVEGPAMGLDVPSRPHGNVIPAHAGIQSPGTPWRPAYAAMTLTLGDGLSARQRA